MFELIRVYGASKLHHAPLWDELQNSWIDEVRFVMRWPFLHVKELPDEAWLMKVCWQHNAEDIALAEVILVYAQPQDTLRGALVEAGMGLALGKEVIVCGQNEGFGTWSWHKNVHRANDLEDARLLLKAMSLRYDR